jgi:hypothetical protein
LTGLPPTREEIKHFLEDKNSNSYEKLVDRLLTKKQYGEHMTKYWLDLVRFADTNGRHHDHYRDMTPYRDWVIKSFNNNLKYDNFVRYQIAGDLYDKPSEDQLVASGFNRLHLIIDRGTAPPEESYTRNVIDRVTSVGTAFMGLTVQCAQCHDHKYDPVTQKDFFALFAFFNNFDGGPETGGRSGDDFKNGLQKPYIYLSDPNKKKEPEGKETAVKSLNPFWIWKKGKITTEKANFKKTFTLKTKVIKAFLKATCDNGFKLKVNGKSVGKSTDWQKPLKVDVARYLKVGKNEILVEADNVGDMGGFILSLQADSLSIITDKSWQAQAPKGAWHSAVQLKPHGEAPWNNILGGSPAAQPNNRKAAMVMKEAAKIKPAYILKRGDYQTPGEKVERNTPEFLPPLKKKEPVASRMDFANWLIESNPLTARVTVNRFWQQLFGTGIVKTSEDFGAQGEVPSHPELLDHLTVYFQKSGWDVKALMKYIVMSKTYRQTSTASKQLFEEDADNRLLARGSRYRMDSEMIRDQILFSSGLLSGKMYGKSVKPPQPEGLWKAVAMPYSYPKTFKADSGESIYRRSVYTFWKRGMPPPQMTILNAPVREECIARRERTNTPLQALLLMNEKEYMKAAAALAVSIIGNSALNDEQKLLAAYETVTSKLPDKYEKEILLKLVKDTRDFYKSNGTEADKLVALTGSASGPKAEIAAWTVLVNSLFNLDITKTRE